MKKILIALTVVLTLCLSLVGCGTKDGADYLFDSVGGAVESLEQNKLMSFVNKETDTLGITVSADDLSGLEDYGIDIPEIKDVSAAVYLDVKNVMAAQTVSGKVEGEAVDISLYENEENIVISSPLLNESYSLPIDELIEALEDEADIYISDVLDSLEGSGSVLKDISDLGEEYNKAIKKIIRDNVEFEVERDGKNVIVTFEITDKELDDIFTDLADVIEDDDKLDDLLYAYDAGIDTGDIANELPHIFDGMNISAEFEMVIQKKNDVILEAEVLLFENEVSVGTLTYEYDVKTEDFTLEIVESDGETGKVVISGESGGKNEYTYTAEVYVYGEKEIEASLDITASEITVSGEDAYGTGFEVTFLYKIDKKSLRLELLSIGTGGFSIDLEDYGLAVTVEKDVKVPAAPKKTAECDDIYEFGEEVGDALYEALDDIGLFDY